MRCPWARSEALTNFDGAVHFCQHCGAIDHEPLPPSRHVSETPASAAVMADDNTVTVGTTIHDETVTVRWDGRWWRVHLNGEPLSQVWAFTTRERAIDGARVVVPAHRRVEA